MLNSVSQIQRLFRDTKINQRKWVFQKKKNEESLEASRSKDKATMTPILKIRTSYCVTLKEFLKLK